MNLKLKSTSFLTLLTALVLAACGGGGGVASTDLTEITAQTSGDLRIALLSETGDLSQGQNSFLVRFESADGTPVDAGTVTVGSSMAMPGMAPMIAPIELEPAGQTGEYSLEGDFEMSGSWQFEIAWNGPVGTGSTTFSVNVR